MRANLWWLRAGRIDPWDYDQHLVTRLILESKLCSAKADNAVWKKVGLKPVPRSELTADQINGCYGGTFR